MRYDFFKAKSMIEQGHYLTLIRVAKQVRARITTAEGSVLGTITVKTREELLDKVPMRIAAKEARRTVWAYDYAYVERIKHRYPDCYPEVAHDHT